MRSRCLCITVVLVAASSTGCPADDAQPFDGGQSDGGGPCPDPCALEVVAGTLDRKGLADGPADGARFWNPIGVVGDSKVLYVADTDNAVIRRIDRTTGEVSTFAGDPDAPSPRHKPRDGSTSEAGFYRPRAVALLGNDLYVGDYIYLRRINLTTRTVETIRSKTTNWLWGQFEIQALTAVGAKLYIGAGMPVIWVYDPATGEHPKAFIGGQSLEPRIVDGDWSTARFFSVRGLATDGASRLYVADFCLLREVDMQAQTVTTVAGGLQTNGDPYCAHEDGTAGNAKLFDLRGLGHDGTHLYAVELPGPRDGVREGVASAHGAVRRFDPATGQLTTVAGQLPKETARVGEANGPALQARLYRPAGIWSDGVDLYLTTASTVRKISSSHVSTLAGRMLDGTFLEPGPVSGSGDHVYTVVNGFAELARIEVTDGKYSQMGVHEPTFPIEYGSSMTRAGDLIYVAGHESLASRNIASYSSDVLLQSHVLDHGGLTTDGKHLYYLVRTKSQAGFYVPLVLDVDPADPQQPAKIDALDVREYYDLAYLGGSLYISDGSVVHRLDTGTGQLTTVAGSQDAVGCQDGKGSQARLIRAAGIATYGTRLLVGDTGCHAVRLIDPKSGEVSTLPIQSGASAGLYAPGHLDYDLSTDTLYVADIVRDMIFKLELAPP